MNIFEAFTKRVSYREAYLPGTIPNAALRRIVESALLAPSGRNRQTTSIIAVTNPDTITVISEIIDKPNISNAGALLVFVFDPTEEYGVEDCAAACENALLAITASGYASCWLDGVLKRDNRKQRIADLLKVPSSLDVRVVLPIGRPAVQQSSPVKKPISERAYLDIFGVSL